MGFLKVNVGDRVVFRKSDNPRFRSSLVGRVLEVAEGEGGIPQAMVRVEGYAVAGPSCVALYDWKVWHATHEDTPASAYAGRGW